MTVLPFSHRVQRRLARWGFVVERHPAVRRQAMLTAHDVNVVLDVGAARGDFGRELRDFGYRHRIVSFEPLPSVFQQLAATVEGDPSWTVRNLALGEESGRGTINVASNSDSSSLLAMGQAHRTAAPEVVYTTQQDVAVVRLDDLAAELLPPGSRAYLKLDTQGFEREVLAGAAETLPRCVGLQLELSFVPLYEGGMLIDEAISYLYRLGFGMVGIERGFTSPEGQVMQADALFFRGAASEEHA
jgi:FkbM family methyltransferase